MTIHEAITLVDSHKHNTYSDRDKLRWLSVLEAMVQQMIAEAGGEKLLPFPGFDDETSGDTALTAPAPYDEMYLRWLEAQIDYHNAEFDKYNNALSMFQAVFDSYRNALTRKSAPKAVAFRYF